MDIESTGLHELSHPLSIGVARCDGTSDLALVRPHWRWRDWPWDLVSSAIHGLERAVLERDGMDARDAAGWINALCAGRRVASGAPEWDTQWLGVLFKAAGMEPSFVLEHAVVASGMALAARMPGVSPKDLLAAHAALVADVCERWPHTHRADADALSLAMVHREACGLPPLSHGS